MRIKDRRGLLLITSLLFVTCIATVMMIGLTRSMAELMASQAAVSAQQTFQLAEAGIDETLAEYSAGGGDGERRSFSASEGWSDCAAGCRIKELDITGVPVRVRVNDIQASKPVVRTATLGHRTPRALEAQIEPGAGFPPALGAVTSVQDDTAVTQDANPFDFQDSSPTWTIDGRDAGFAEAGCSGIAQPALPAITVTDDDILQHAVNPDLYDAASQGSMPEHLLGAPGDFFYVPSEALSIHSSQGDATTLTSADVELFIEEACAKADYVLANATSGILTLTAGAIPTAGGWGTANDPQIVCLGIDHPTGERKIRLDGVQGAGVLIAKANLTLFSGVNNYDGLIISYGQNSEFDFTSAGAVRGAVIVAPTGADPSIGEFEMADNGNPRLLQYCSCCLEKAGARFVQKGGALDPVARIRFWQDLPATDTP